MFCEECGQELPDGAVKCKKCGHPVPEAALMLAEKKTDSKKPETNKRAEKKNGNKKSDDKKSDDKKNETKKGADKKAESADKDRKQEIKEASQAGKKKKEHEQPETLPVVSTAVSDEDAKREAYEKGIEEDIYYPSVTEKTDTSASDKEDAKLLKKTPVGLVILLAVISVAVICFCAVLVSPSLRNKLKKSFLSDDAYYKNVQRESFETEAERVFDWYDDFLDDFDPVDFKYSFDSEFEISDEASAFLEKLKEKNGTDLSWLENGEVEFDVSLKDRMGAFNATADMNGYELLEAASVADLANAKIYLGLPILSDKSAGISLADYVSGETLSEKIRKIGHLKSAMPTEKELKDFTEGLFDIVFEELPESKMFEEKSIHVSGVTTDCTNVTMDMDTDQTFNLLTEALLYTRNSDIVRKVVNRFIDECGLDEYAMVTIQDYIDSMIEKMQNYPKNDISVRIEASIMPNGDICAFTVKIRDDECEKTFGYKYALNDGNFGFEGTAVEKTLVSGRMEGLSANAKGTYHGNEYTGAFSVNDSSNGDAERCRIYFEKINLKKLRRGEIDGTLILDLYRFTQQSTYRDMVLKAECDDAGILSGDISIGLYDDEKSVANAEIEYSTGTSGSIRVPSKVTEALGEDALRDWISSFDWDKLIKYVEKAKLPSSELDTINRLKKSDGSSIINTIMTIMKGCLQKLH